MNLCDGGMVSALSLVQISQTPFQAPHYKIHDARTDQWRGPLHGSLAVFAYTYLVSRESIEECGS